MARKVTKRELRDIWNDSAFQADLLRRSTERVFVYDELAPSGADQKEGALSQIYDLYDNRTGELLGTFHRYQNPDGTVGASGLADPVFLLVEGVPTVDP